MTLGIERLCDPVRNRIAEAAARSVAAIGRWRRGATVLLCLA